MKTYKLLLLFVASMVLTFEAGAMKKDAEQAGDNGDGKSAKRANVGETEDRDSKKIDNTDLKKLVLVQELLESCLRSYVIGSVSKIKITLLPKNKLPENMTASFELDVAAMSKKDRNLVTLLDSNLVTLLDNRKTETIARLIRNGLESFLTSFHSQLNAFSGFEYRVKSANTYTSYTSTFYLE